MWEGISLRAFLPLGSAQGMALSISHRPLSSTEKEILKKLLGPIWLVSVTVKAASASLQRLIGLLARETPVKMESSSVKDAVLVQPGVLVTPEAQRLERGQSSCLSV